ncbi:MAG: TolC family protein [Terriglobia bacterium]
MKLLTIRSLAFFLGVGVLATLIQTVEVWGQQAAGPRPAGDAAKVMDFDYTRTHSFPNILDSFAPLPVPQPRMENSPRLRDLIREGKLWLSLEDTISLTLENNLDIDVARFTIPLAQADYLRSKSGSAARGVTGVSSISTALFAGAIGSSTTSGSSGSSSGAGGAGFSGGGAENAGSVGCCDPVAGFSMSWDQNKTPLGTIVLTGVPSLTNQQTSYSTYFGQGFMTGTSYVVALYGDRSTTTALTSLVNPEVPSGMVITFSQNLLNGFGYRANASSLRIAKNDLQLTDSVFRQQVMTTIAQVVNLYSDLLYYRENVRVAEDALKYAQTLMKDNTRQVEIGAMAAIEITRAKSEVAARRQDLIVAQTSYHQQEETLKTALAKHVDADLAGVAIEPTDKLPEPKPNDIPPLEEALTEALKNRPEIEQADLNMRNQNITIQAVRNRLLPTLNVFASYGPTGLSGHFLCGGNPLYEPACPQGVTGYVPGGASDALSQVFHDKFPYYSFGVNLSIPIRNRAAQADEATALIQERQMRVKLQQQINQIQQDVRNAVIAVTQAQVRIDAAKESTALYKETLEGEQKKFLLGESTPFLVIQAQRDLTTAEGNEANARDTYAKALVQYAQATATVLDRYHIEISEAKSGQVTRAMNIPGAEKVPASSGQ